MEFKTSFISNTSPPTRSRVYREATSLLIAKGIIEKPFPGEECKFPSDVSITILQVGYQDGNSKYDLIVGVPRSYFFWGVDGNL